MNQNPLISVIVPVYKVEKYLRKCVDSIRNQTYENLEIILVDDGSPDSCGSLCEEFAREDERILVIHKENGGLSSARNAGIDGAKGDYLGFVDSDDWIEPDAYEKMMAMVLSQGAELVCAGRYDVDEQTGERTRGLCPLRQETITAQEMIGRIFIWDQCDSAAWDKLYSARLFEGIRYPEGAYYEDIPTTYRIAERAGKVCMLNVPVYNYLHRANSITTAPVSEKTFHWEQHTDRIYPYMLQNHREIGKQARYFRVRSLAFSVMSLDQTDEKTRNSFRDQMKRSRKKLRSHFFFILTGPYFGKQERLTDLLMCVNWYRNLRKFRHPEG